MKKVAEQSVRMAGLAAAGALTVGAIAGCFPDYDGFAAPIAALALPAMAFSAGAVVAGRITRLSRRPLMLIVALVPLAPIHPEFATLIAAGFFAVLGLVAAGLIDPIVAAFARERTASVFGSVFLLAAAGLAVAAGQAAVQLMPLLLALAGTVAALALSSVWASRDD